MKEEITNILFSCAEIPDGWAKHSYARGRSICPCDEPSITNTEPNGFSSVVSPRLPLSVKKSDPSFPKANALGPFFI